jgi:metal-sulfur cluster biosynthetic enzyme
MTVSKDQVLEVLDTIIDPCSRAAGAPAGLVDMGLVKTVDLQQIEGRTNVHVVVGVTEFGCMIGPSFAMEAYKRLAPLPGIGEVSVDLDDSFGWTPSDMSDAYRATLAEQRKEGRTNLLPIVATNHGGPFV